MPPNDQTYDNYYGHYYKTPQGRKVLDNARNKWRRSLMLKYNCNINKALIIHKYANIARATAYGVKWQHLRSKDAYVADWYVGGTHKMAMTLGEADRMTIAELEKSLKEIQAHIDKTRMDASQLDAAKH